MMLTFAEIPGIYVQPDTGRVEVFDHVNVTLLERTPGRLRLHITNPTAFPARVKLLVETSTAARHTALGPNALYGAPTVSLRPGETVERSVASGA